MAAWFVPALKAVLPHVGSIISAARPVFSKRNTEQQIAELQAAASQNSADIKELAAQLETTVRALEEAASMAEARVRRLQRLCAIALGLSALALAAALVLLAR